MKIILKRIALTVGFLVPIAAVSYGFDQESVLANWKEHCVKCHAMDGSGKTKNGRKLRVQDYRDPAIQAKFKDENMMRSMTEGLTNKSGKQIMKPYNDKLSEQEMLDLISFIRTLGSES